MSRRLLYLIPLLLFAGLFGYLLGNLGKDPGVLPSALIDEPTPEFDLPPLPGREPAKPLATRHLENGEPQLVNFFASWCLPCRAEHPLMVELVQKHGVAVHAVNYKDEAAEAVAWLRALGDSYDRIGYDRDGRAGIEFGIYGVPETFMIDGQGHVRYRHAGPLTPELVADVILPMLESAK